MTDLAFVTDFPFAVEDIERIFIPMPDGTRLAARLWLPEDARQRPVPAIIEMHPYRTRDLFRRPDEMNAPYWAGHGYGVLRVDIRGSGDSDGVLTDEYAPAEIADGAAVVAWAKAQSWCDGSVGLTGLSWSGFTALRVATRHPEAVKALFVCGVSDDGYVTDIHHLGGVPYSGRASWAGVMTMFNALPPDPATFEGDWKAAWIARLKANRSWMVLWTRHQTRDAFWQDKAVFGPDRHPTAPLLVMGGLADKYKTPTLRLLSRWRGPALGVLGPWEHIYPHLAQRGPAIGYLQEGLRWFDHWLKGKETGVTEEPALRVFVERPDRGDGPAGAWVPIKEWPAATLPLHTFMLDTDDRLVPAGSHEPAREDTSVTLTARPAPVDGFPSDDIFSDKRRPVDLDAMAAAGHAVFRGEPLETPLSLLSVPILRASVRPARPSGQLTAWLIDQAPDGSAQVITRGARNLVFTTGTDVIDRPTAGEDRDVILAFDASAWTFEAGHRLVLAVGAHGWPTLWPAPDGGDLMVPLDTLRLDLPGLPPAASDEAPVTFPDPHAAVPGGFSDLKWIDPARHTLPAPGPETQMSMPNGFAANHIDETGTDVLVHGRFDLGLTGDGQQAKAVEHWLARFERLDWSVTVETTAGVESTPDTYRVTWTIRAHHGDELVFATEESVSVPRQAY